MWHDIVWHFPEDKRLFFSEWDSSPPNRPVAVGLTQHLALPPLRSAKVTWICPLWGGGLQLHARARRRQRPRRRGHPPPRLCPRPPFSPLSARSGGAGVQGQRSQSPTLRQPPGPAGRCGRERRTAREGGRERGPGVHGSSPGRLAASYRPCCPTRAASRRKPPPGLTRRGPSCGRRGAKVGNRGRAPKLSVRRLRRLPPLHSPSSAAAKPARAPSAAGAAAPLAAELYTAEL